VTALGSCLYQGRVRHTRLEPFRHRFEYGLYYMLLDIDELERLSAQLGLFSLGHFNLYSFHASDHGLQTVAEIRPWVEGVLTQAGVRLEGGSIKLLALPRILGYVFNPLSVWYCYDEHSRMRAVIHEVRNTFGDRHIYVVPILERADLEHSFEKRMHVSPFNDMEQTYHFTINEPGERLAIAIEQSDAAGAMFRAGLQLTRIPLTDRNLLRMFVAHPLLTWHVIVGIHWQAFRLWLKGARYRKRPEPGPSKVTVVGNVRVSS
jgi:DUF1365 family protein